MDVDVLKVEAKGAGVEVTWRVDGKTPEGLFHKTHINSDDEKFIKKELTADFFRYV